MISLSNIFCRAPRVAAPPLSVSVQLQAAIYARAGNDFRMVSYGETQWASATFTGSRHQFVIRFFGEYANVYLVNLVTALRNDVIDLDGALICDFEFKTITPRMGECEYAELEVAALLLHNPPIYQNIQGQRA